MFWLGEMILVGIFFKFVFPVIGMGWGIFWFTVLMVIIRPSESADVSDEPDRQLRTPEKT